MKSDDFLPDGLRLEGDWRQRARLVFDQFLDWLAQQIAEAQARAQQPDDEVSRAAACLGIAADAGVDEIRSAFRRRLMEVHPDHGGDAEQTKELIAARDLLLRRIQETT